MVCDRSGQTRKIQRDSVGMKSRNVATISSLLPAIVLTGLFQPTVAIHHLQLPAVHLANRQNSDLPLIVSSYCSETIYPAIFTQSGTGPEKSGFRLDTGQTVAQNVSADWRGRVWGRTNCTFDRQVGVACASGDCGPSEECHGVGNPPATLAEFTYSSASNQAFYDISLVDGYNLPMGIILTPGNNSNPALKNIPPNLSNIICIGTASYLTGDSSAPDVDFGSNSTYPIPLERSVTTKNVLKWCPWPLQLNPPQKPGDGVYPYPDDNIQRPVFNPCYSACSKWNKDQYCCAGSYNSPKKCKPSYYSRQAKRICPDAYSYAYDDQTSTFVLPQGVGFEVVFCPTGRSSNILVTFGEQMREVARLGLVTQDVEELARNKTYIELKSDAGAIETPSMIALAILLFWACFW